MQERIEQLRSEAEREIASASSLEALEDVRVRYFGRKAGRMTSLTKAMSELPLERRPAAGKMINEAKVDLEAKLERRRLELETASASRIQASVFDMTFPGRRPSVGRLHPITSTLETVCDIFLRMGFQIRLGPEIETDFHNFEALNIPKDHPARDMQDTFYLPNDMVLRTHTSPVQIRTMLAERPPIQMIAPGKVYRKDSDLSHSPVFHQVEGLMVGKDVNMGHLKAVLHLFAESVFGKGTSIRLRPSFFPFTEPSAEMDIQCALCQGGGCKVCGGSGWIEILGAGMVDPQVFLNVGYDPAQVTGFAFGMGIERIAMLRYGISNIRMFYENDLRLLEQF